MDDFWRKVVVKDIDDCWEWSACKDKNGYGKLTYGGKPFLAHRMAFISVHGSIRKGYFICHKCDNPSCVNPAHLFEGTHRDNMEDMLQKGRSPNNKGVNNPRYDNSEYVFIHKDGRMFNGTRHDFCEEFNLPSSNVSCMVNRKRNYNSVKGWYIKL